MDQAVEDGVGVGGVANQRVPLIDGELAGDDGGAAAVTVLKDLQEVVTSRGVERLEAPVVEDEQIDTAKCAQQPGVAAIATGQSQIAEQPRDALIKHGAIVAAGLVAERRGEPALADAGQSRDIVPRNSLSRLLSDIRIIHLPGSGSLSFVGSSMQV
jgi:hypothetical protein